MKLIHEYAVDPDIIKDWRSLRVLRPPLGLDR